MIKGRDLQLPNPRQATIHRAGLDLWTIFSLIFFHSSTLHQSTRNSFEPTILRRTFGILARHFIVKCLANIKFFAGHFVRRDQTHSPDIFRIRRTCPASPANFAYSAYTYMCFKWSSLVFQRKLQNIQEYVLRGDAHDIVKKKLKRIAAKRVRLENLTSIVFSPHRKPFPPPTLSQHRFCPGMGMFMIVSALSCPHPRNLAFW